MEMNSNLNDENQNNEKAEVSDACEKEIMQSLKKAADKQTFYARLTMLFVGGIFIVVLAAVLMLLPEVMNTIGKYNDVADQAQDVVAKATVTLDNADEAIDSVSQASNNINTMVGDNGDDLTKAIENLSNIDYEGLNNAIVDLQKAVGPLAKLFGN
ncbi:MAG: hypothetical protein K6F69_01270 [Treponema sp.]|nr:hypothetical protein [Treponema sp.]